MLSSLEEQPQRDQRRHRAKVSQPILDRLLPHAPEAEQGVIGCILLEPNTCIAQAVEKIRVKEVFYDPRHQVIYEVLVEMYDRREPIDLISLQQTLRDKKQLDEVGGLAYLAILPDTVPSAANLDYYLGIVVEKHRLRELICHCTDVVSRAYDDNGEVQPLLESAERGMMQILTNTTKTQVTIKEAVRQVIGEIENLHQRNGEMLGIPTGIHGIDKMTQGLHGGEVTVIAARPSVGKTSLAMNIADHVAVDLQLPVGVFSLEMTQKSLVFRTMCSRAQVDAQRIREGYLTESDFPKLMQAASKIGKAPLHIDDTAGLSIIQMRSKARRMHQLYGIKLFVIDYLQLLHGSGKKRQENRQQEVTEISNGVKELAKELDVPVIVLSQLNRDLEKSKNQKPKLSDLRESGSIEQDADVVHLLYKPDEANDYLVDDIIAKQRNGPTGTVHLHFFKQLTRFEMATQEEVPE